MERNKLNEIRKIKNLIYKLENKDLFINEASDEECKTQLTDAGYRIYGSSFKQDSAEKLESDCNGNENLKSIIEILDKDNIKYELKDSGGNCYIFLKSKSVVGDVTNPSSYQQDIKKCNIPRQTTIFWGDGDVMYTTYLAKNNGDEDYGILEISGVEIIYIKKIFYGTYDIDKTNQEIKFEDMEIKYGLSYDLDSCKVNQEKVTSSNIEPIREKIFTNDNSTQLNSGGFNEIKDLFKN